MEKWWKVPRGRTLTASQQAKAVKMIMEWIALQLGARVIEHGNRVRSDSWCAK